jgi:hypothetical protein
MTEHKAQQAVEDQDPYLERTLVPPDPNANPTASRKDGPDTYSATDANGQRPFHGPERRQFGG